MVWKNKQQKNDAFKMQIKQMNNSIPFLAFWLRSNVVFVPISLTPYMWIIDLCDIKLIFLGGGQIRVACEWITQM